jgi:hypothetical protein
LAVVVVLNFDLGCAAPDRTWAGGHPEKLAALVEESDIGKVYRALKTVQTESELDDRGSRVWRAKVLRGKGDKAQDTRDDVEDPDGRKKGSHCGRAVLRRKRKAGGKVKMPKTVLWLAKGTTKRRSQ